MSTQVTDPLTVADAASRRQAYTTAQAVAQYITEITPVIPADLVVRCSRFGEPAAELDLHFYHSVADVAEFGRFFGLLVTEKPRDGRPYAEASGVVDGVPVRAWTLLPVVDSVVAA